MFDLMAIDNEGLTLDRIAEIPLLETRAPLLGWLDAGAKHPARIVRHADADVLRKMQQTLSFHGVRTELKRVRQVSASQSGFERVVDTAAPTPPSRDAFVGPTPEQGSQESGLIEYRKMVADQEARRTSASHLIAAGISGLRWAHVGLFLAIAIAGILVAMAGEAGAEDAQDLQPARGEMTQLGR